MIAQIRSCAACIVLSLGASASALAQVAAPVTEPAAAESSQEIIKPRTGYEARNHWENAFDVKFTDFYERKAADVGSPTLMLTAQWNYKLSTDTFLGFSANGMPQPQKRTVDGVKYSYSTYSGGLYLGQRVFDTKPYRLVVGVTGGRGIIYTRAKIPDQATKAEAKKYNVIEPGAYLTFIAYHGVEIGAAVSLRQAKLLDGETEQLKNDDLSAMAYGLTFRSQRY